MSADEGSFPILLVDDRPQDLLALEAILAAPDREIVTASSGAAALRALLAREFGAVVMDVMMPGMDGFELAGLIRSRARTAQVPILFLTSAGDDVRSIYRAYTVGAVDFMVKPVDPDILRAKVAVLAELHNKDKRIDSQARALVEAERKAQAAELLRVQAESDRRYQNLADAISHIVWTADATGKITHVNRRLAEFSGRGDTPSWLDIVHPDDRVNCEERWQEARSTREPFEAECRLRRADGVYRWHLCRALPELNESGKIVGWLGTHTDFDEVVRSRVEAEESRRRLTFLVEVSAVLQSSLDVARGFSELARLAVAEMADDCVVSVVDPDARTAFTQLVEHKDQTRGEKAERALVAIAALVQGEAPALVMSAEEEILSRIQKDKLDGDSTAWLETASIMIVPIVARNRTLGTVTFFRADPHRPYGKDDLAMATEIGRRAGDALDNALLYRGSERAIQARDEFLSVASHELRTPLSALLLQLGSLEKLVDSEAATATTALADPRHAKKVKAALRHTHRLTKLVDNLLDVSRLSRKRLELEIEICDLGAIAHDVVERFSEEAKEARCPIAVKVAGDANGSWDRLRLEQVLTNLLSNAVKYGRGAPIEVDVGGDLDRVRVWVRDHGIGIAEQDQARIFDRFERAVPVRHYGGLGLGLYIVRQIVEAHGGVVSIESKPGSGTTFCVDLPREHITQNGMQKLRDRNANAPS